MPGVREVLTVRVREVPEVPTVRVPEVRSHLFRPEVG